MAPCRHRHSSGVRLQSLTKFPNPRAAGHGGIGRSSTSSFVVSNTAQSPSGLVAAYGFNEGSGVQVADASGQGNTGTISSATWATTGRAQRPVRGAAQYVDAPRPEAVRKT